MRSLAANLKHDTWYSVALSGGEVLTARFVGAYWRGPQQAEVPSGWYLQFRGCERCACTYHVHLASVLAIAPALSGFQGVN